MSINAKCPMCGSAMVEKDKQFSCSTAKWKKDAEDKWENEGCNYSIRKNSLEKFGKPILTVEEVETLLEQKVVEVTLKSKDKGTDYKKNIIIDEQWGVKVDFSSNSKDTEPKEPAPAPKDEDLGEPAFKDTQLEDEDEKIPF